MPKPTQHIASKIEIQWWFQFVLIKILRYDSDHYKLWHMAAMLLWHVQKFVVIWWVGTELLKNQIYITSQTWSVKCVPGVIIVTFVPFVYAIWCKIMVVPATEEMLK